MKLSPQWLRDFVDVKVDDRRLAEDLTSIGMAVEGTSGAGPSTVFEMEIGTNRPDAMNHYGVAREASAFYDLPLAKIEPKLPKPTPSAPFPIAIAEPQLCPRFTGLVLRNVTIKSSPAKIVARLSLLEQRPINNAVDATNYVLWEMGKPTHVFDLDLLEGGRIVVRRARDGEKLKTLDGVERKLSTEDLVVADAQKPVGLAGVMGGYDTMITDTTKNILIESAWWDPVTIRKVSKRHALHTDASHRFERGADFESTILSCNRVAELTLQSGGGEVVGDVVDVIARRIDQAPIALRLSEVHRILGKALDAEEVIRILRKLGFEVTPETRDAAESRVLTPSWRLDVEREIDLIEEVARLYGYDKFPNTLPAFAGSVIEQLEAKKDRRLRSSLLALGYSEAISLTFISRQEAHRFSSAQPIEIANPLSEEASAMRTSIVPGMLEMLAYNLNRGSNNVRLFEAGNVYDLVEAKSFKNSRERKRACLGATGSVTLPSAMQSARPYSFYDLKGDVETLLEGFDHASFHFDDKADGYYHSGRSARVVMDGSVVAQFGEIHPEVSALWKLRQDVYIAELYLDQLYEHALHEPLYTALPRYPAVERDFSFVFSDSVIYEQIQDAINRLAIRELRSFMPAEIFRGEAVSPGKYSLLLRATFQSGERTLREDEVAQWSEKIVRALRGLGGVQRA